MINETTPRFFITEITKENEQSVIDKLERSGFSNWWSLPEDKADYIFCLLYNSDAADERSIVLLVGRRVIKTHFCRSSSRYSGAVKYG